MNKNQPHRQYSDNTKLDAVATRKLDFLFSLLLCDDDVIETVAAPLIFTKTVKIFSSRAKTLSETKSNCEDDAI